MPKKKFYAVRKGKKAGLYRTWDECKKQVTGFQGAIYQGFPTEKEARSYLKGEEPPLIKSKSVYNPDQGVFLKNFTYIFCDGSEIKQSSALDKSGFGISILRRDPKNSFIYATKIGTESNNRAELKALLYSLTLLDKGKLEGFNFCLVTDSEYSLNAVFKWSPAWIKNGWINTKGLDVENQDLIKSLLEILPKLKDKKYNLLFKHLMAHQKKPTNIKSYDYFLWFGNELADKLAKLGSTNIIRFDTKLDYPQIWDYQT